MADTDDETWTLVKARAADLDLPEGVEHYDLGGMECRYFRAGEMGGVDIRADRVNIHCDRDKRITKIDIG